MFTLPRTKSLLLDHRVSGDTYRIDVAMPEGPPPAAGWPSIYLLDASDCFGTCVEASRRMCRRPNATGVSPAVIIGISSPAGDSDGTRRERDFARGAHGFLDFLEHEVRPLVSQRLAIDARRQTLFGHSLAGYFALWVLCHRPQAFRNYAAISPSIWWDKSGLFDAASKVTLEDRRVFIALGEWEDGLPPWQLAAPDSAEVLARRKARAMLATARELSLRLLAHHAEERVHFSVFPEEDHASVISVAIPRVLRLASLP